MIRVGCRAASVPDASAHRVRLDAGGSGSLVDDKAQGNQVLSMGRAGNVGYQYPPFDSVLQVLFSVCAARHPYRVWRTGEPAVGRGSPIGVANRRTQSNQ